MGNAVDHGGDEGLHSVRGVARTMRERIVCKLIAIDGVRNWARLLGASYSPTLHPDPETHPEPMHHHQMTR